MYSSLDVHNRLQELDVPHELFKLSGQAGSFQSAAAGLGLEPGQTARVELFRLDSEPVMVIVPGDREVDESKLMSISGASSVSRVTRYPPSRVSWQAPSRRSPTRFRCPPISTITRSRRMWYILAAVSRPRSSK
jgi:Aminoacyl-tRNA editing domain